MTKERTFLDVCEDFVQIADKTFLEFLAFMATCKWFNTEEWCEKFAAEDWRQNVWTPDTEEEWVVNQAWEQYLLSKGDNNE